MSLYTLAEIKAEIAVLKLKIDKAEDQQANTSGGPGQGSHFQRGDLRAMYERLAKLEAEYIKQEARETSDTTHLVQFERPQ